MGPLSASCRFEDHVETAHSSHLSIAHRPQATRTSERHALPAKAKSRFTPELLTYLRFGIMNGTSIPASAKSRQERAVSQVLPCFGVNPVYPNIPLALTIMGRSALPDIAQNVLASLVSPSPVVLGHHGESRSLHHTTCATSGTDWLLPGFSHRNPAYGNFLDHYTIGDKNLSDTTTSDAALFRTCPPPFCLVLSSGTA